MNRLFDVNLDLPEDLTRHILGAVFSGVGIIATTAYGCYAKIAVISPEELALQPLHVVLILFIIALATFIALILRAVWGRGLSTMNRFADCLENLSKLIGEMREDQKSHLQKFQELSIDALKAKASKNEELTKIDNKRKHRRDD